MIEDEIYDILYVWHQSDIYASSLHLIIADRNLELY